MKDKFITAVVAVWIMLPILILGIMIGVRFNKSNNEYHLVLDNQDAEIILETVDEIVSRQIVK